MLNEHVGSGLGPFSSKETCSSHELWAPCMCEAFATQDALTSGQFQMQLDTFPGHSAGRDKGRPGDLPPFSSIFSLVLGTGMRLQYWFRDQGLARPCSSDRPTVLP